MRKIHNTTLVPNAQTLRKNQTKEEKKLWYEFLRNLPIHFSRQKVIGNYIVDFYCTQAKLVIELDGSQHYEEQERLKDKLRDENLELLGIKVLRYSNYELNKNFNGVCADIWNHLQIQ